MFGPDHRFTYANDALLTMWGKTWEEAIGKTCLELGYEPWHAEMHDREIEQVIATKQPVRGEVPFTGTHGRRIYEYIFVPVIGVDGEVEAVAGTTRDVTERKRDEDALRETALKLAEANRLKDEFLGTLSHELRTPLNAVVGWTHILRQGTLAPGLLERALDSIERNANSQQQLVEDLLDVSRIVSGKLAMKAEPVDVGTVATAASDTVRLSAVAKGITLTVTTDPAVTITGDADRLQQVVWNLLSNAIKFTPRGGDVALRMRRRGELAEITVSDSGEGITPEFLPHVFDRFRQADGGTSRRHGGLGIGLTIVRHLVEAHGGIVAAESAGPGLGATFTVRIPLREL